jgi:8-oxo-dGTP pyrophosphatase MutT (NUDIX family)
MAWYILSSSQVANLNSFYVSVDSMKHDCSPGRPKGWQIDQTRTLLTTPIMQVIASKVHCDRTGNSHDFYKFAFPRWVNVVATTTTGHLVLIRQYRFGTDRMELEIPGGAVNDGEDPLAAGLRELLEETGYAGENGRIIGKVCPNPAIQGNFCYTVWVENVRQIAEPRLDDMEDIEVLTLPPGKVASLVTDGSINHGLVLNGLMFFAMEMAKRSSAAEKPEF